MRSFVICTPEGTLFGFGKSGRMRWKEHVKGNGN
jgi:hypothetical protein